MNIYAKSGPEWTPLVEHLKYVCTAVEKVAIHLGMDTEVARNGAILHDIGKSHPVFKNDYEINIKSMSMFLDMKSPLYFFFLLFLVNNGMN